MEVEHLHALLVIPFLTLCLIGKAVGIDGNQWAISQRRQCAESTLDIVCVKGNDQINVHRVPDMAMGIDGQTTRDDVAHLPFVQCLGDRFECGDSHRCSSSEARQSARRPKVRSEEHTSALQTLMRISYAVF